ncbi:LysR family transcriptional regulator [Pseudoroseomonas ludipueritiae]|uniref:LysR family transcriptional regulator n=1 Tax=Pseudoroseomonas ludipueritiae TaxID=198093 RepID=A0ABR7RBX7_9PROT|nr:LysR family transcriptional regulator [Pseudoroseomonas ludipueritiae]MBC9179285.1 LysR family transcriptional regulator [Pseudoroseomonas ludipueritiae]MCG7361277.1 LysR family transcriptional regulator [Roseomonas sp. ACRSG]
MNVTLKQLRVFCALYEMRSFTAAARAAFVTQSAVSKLCAELEAEVGQPLFERSTRSVIPCDGAADFYAYAQEVLGTIRAAERSMSGLRSLERGVVGVATSPLMMIGLVGEPIRAFHRRYPGVKLDLYELSSDDTIEHVRHGRVDFGIVALEEAPEHLETQVIYRDTMFAVCAPAHPLARLTVVLWKDLATHDHVALRNVYAVRRSLDRLSAKLGLSFSYRVEAGLLTSVLSMVQGGLGITVVPGYACHFARQLGLRVIGIEDAHQQGHELSLIRRRNARLSFAAETFLQDLKVHLEERGRSPEKA